MRSKVSFAKVSNKVDLSRVTPLRVRVVFMSYIVSIYELSWSFFDHHG